MSKQLRFFATRKDMAAFLLFAECIGCQAIAEVIPLDSVPVSGRPTVVFGASESAFFYLMPGEFSVVEAFFQDVEFEPGWSKLLPWVSPVIECSHNTPEPNEGRIYLSQDEGDPRYPTTVSCFERLCNWIVENWTKADDGRIFLGKEIKRR